MSTLLSWNNRLVVAGDGRYFNTEAIQSICRVLAGNGVANIWIPQHGYSHNPGGPGEDFGIKYNEELGQPAGEEFTETIYEKSLNIKSFKTITGTDDIFIVDMITRPLIRELQMK